MLKNIWGENMLLKDQELLRRQARNRKYFMNLDSENLLLNFNLEAGRYTASSKQAHIHGGWETPLCQLRGHFLGHWLSAASLRYRADGDGEAKAKADAIVHELALCQQENGGQWAGSIPEKYLHWIAKGKPVWAPQYTLHKTLMGLADMYENTGNEEALLVASRFSDWFLDWSATFTREAFDDILDVETGGMLEVWAQLYGLTGEKKYQTLMERYYRARLFDLLLEGTDVLTNMHANTTIPEVLGCARAFEVTGDRKWRDIVEAYWNQAVVQRGQYATGGQTCGEIWTPTDRMGARLGDKNQEYCTVYNMLRLADYLFTWTHDPVYADYREMGIYNGLMAQSYWENTLSHGQDYRADLPKEGLLTYFLPLRPGAKKGWSTETEDFFCCHGTLVQSNAAWERGILYQEDKDVYLAQYFDFHATLQVDGKDVEITMERDTLTGSFHLSSTSSGKQNIHAHTARYPSNPDALAEVLTVKTDAPVRMKLHIRLPWWLKNEAVIQVNGEPEIHTGGKTSFYALERLWENGDAVRILLPQGICTWALPEDADMLAFLYGPVLLAGICDQEQQLVLGGKSPEQLLVHDNEREWGSWKSSFKTTGQPQGMRFLPMHQVGFETYTTYFPIKS